MFSSMDVATIEYLIAHGADVNVKDTNGYTPLMSHTHKSRIVNGECKDFPAEAIAILRLLLKHGADINARLPNGKTVLDLAIDNQRSGDAEVIRFLIQNGAQHGSDLTKR